MHPYFSFFLLYLWHKGSGDIWNAKHQDAFDWGGDCWGRGQIRLDTPAIFLPRYGSVQDREKTMTNSSGVPQTPYAIAYELARSIAASEGKHLGTDKTDRAYTLELYSQCLEVVATQGLLFTPRGK
jgi:hypothetical protein